MKEIKAGNQDRKERYVPTLIEPWWKKAEEEREERMCVGGRKARVRNLLESRGT